MFFSLMLCFCHIASLRKCSDNDFFFSLKYFCCSLYICLLYRGHCIISKRHIFQAPSIIWRLSKHLKGMGLGKKWILCYTWRYLDTYLGTQVLSSIFFIFLPGYVKCHNDLHRLAGNENSYALGRKSVLEL